MAWVKVASRVELPPGSVLEALAAGNPYALCNAGGDLHALAGVCPHRGGPLGQGALHDTMLVCPWHAWEFDCRTGENDYDKSVRLAKFAVKTEGDNILIEIP